MPTSSCASCNGRARRSSCGWSSASAPASSGPTAPLDRAAVAEVVFAHKEQLVALNGIVHPAVTDEMTRRRQALAATDTTVVLDIPLLIETNHSDLDAVVVVDNSGSLGDSAARAAACWTWICSLPRPEPSDAPVVPIRTRRSALRGE